MPSFADVRSKFQSIESMSDLVSIIKAKWKNLEEFAMIAWLIWFLRNKLRINEVAMLSNKLAQSTTTLLAEFQHGKKQQEPKQRVRPVRWQPPPVDTVKVNFKTGRCSGKIRKLQALGWSYATKKGRFWLLCLRR